MKTRNFCSFRVTHVSLGIFNKINVICLKWYKDLTKLYLFITKISGKNLDRFRLMTVLPPFKSLFCAMDLSEKQWLEIGYCKENYGFSRQNQCGPCVNFIASAKTRHWRLKLNIRRNLCTMACSVNQLFNNVFWRTWRYFLF